MPDVTTAATHATKATATRNDTALELGGGAILLLALGGAAFAVSRRRRNAEEAEWYADEEASPSDTYISDEPRADEPEAMIAEEQPAVIAPAASAFSWGNPRDAETQVENDTTADDRRPGETWVERAYRGPSPSNPSLSLKKRLKRAAFFDRREREVAEGRAIPLEPDAGLPENAIRSDEELVAA